MSVGSCVGWLAVFVETTYIDNADGMVVLTFAVCTDFADASTCFYCAIELNYEMVADTFETTDFVPSVDFFRVHVSTSLCCRTMDYDFIYASHCSCYGETFAGLRQYRGWCST